MRLFRDHAVSTAKLRDVLSGLEAALDGALSPSSRALQTLSVDRYGWCRDVYSDDAEDIWNRQLAAHPDDFETLHHLAILYHGRAFDLEESTDPTLSDADWAKAGQCWMQLLSRDSFWTNLQNGLGNDHKSHSQSIRDRLPLLLLKIHFEIAYSLSTSSHRAKHHVCQAESLTFPRSVVDAARTETYERYVAALPDEVWGGDDADFKVLEGASDKILRILEVDPDCLLALEDGLRIQRRIVSILRYAVAEHDNDNNDARKVSTLKEIAAQKKWKPYFDRFRKQPKTFTSTILTSTSLPSKSVSYKTAQEVVENLWGTQVSAGDLPKALTDAAREAIRGIRFAAGEPPKILTGEVHDNPWGARVAAEEPPKVLPDEVRENLLIWLTCLGDAQMALERFQEAIPFFDDAVAVAAPEESTRPFLVKRACLAHALFARELAASDSKRGYAECKRVQRERVHLSPFVWSLLAEGFAQAKAIGRALETCRKGLAVGHTNLEGDAAHQEEYEAEYEAGRIRLEKLEEALTATVEQLVNGIWEQIKESLSPLGPKTEICKATLREIALSEKEYTPQKVYDQFMQRLKTAPNRFCDRASLLNPYAPINDRPNREIRAKGAIGHDEMNVNTFSRRHWQEHTLRIFQQSSFSGVGDEDESCAIDDRASA